MVRSWIRSGLVSKGVAVEETLGTPGDNEVSLYTRDGKRHLSSPALCRGLAEVSGLSLAGNGDRGPSF